MEIKQYLKNININFKEFNHPAVFTCNEAEKYKVYKEIKGLHSKNLFLKDRKSKDFYLIIIPADKNLEIKRFELLLKQKLKFANETDLKTILDLIPGAVSPFGLINDKDSIVNIIIDKEIWNSDFVSFHPNINTQTFELTKEDFHKYISSLKNKLIII
jgi:Ala-tRNA(Pro) deacylase